MSACVVLMNPEQVASIETDESYSGCENKVKANLEDREKGVAAQEENVAVVERDLAQELRETTRSQVMRSSELKLGRNDRCWCDSGKKYKNCHLASDQSR